jgi:biotin carboxylase
LLKSCQHALVVGTGAHFHALVIELMRRDVLISVVCKTTTFFRLSQDHSYRYVVGVGLEEDADGWIAAAQFIQHRMPITTVISMVDTELYAAAVIAESLGLPWHSADTIVSVHTKPLLRQRLREAGLDSVPFARVETAKDVKDFGENYGWPVIVKPAEGTGSIGVTKVDGPEYADEALCSAMEPTPVTGGGVFVEKYLEGPQYAIETFSENGQHQVVAITKKHSEPHHMIEIGLALPAAVGHESASAIARYISDVFDAMDISFGPTCTELVLTPTGPVIFESQMRLAGSGTLDLIESALKIDMIEFAVRQDLGEMVLGELREKLEVAALTPKAAAIWFAFPDADGVAHTVSGLPESRSMPGVITAESAVPQDGRVHRSKNGWHRYAYVIAEGADSDQAAYNARTAAQHISFMVEVRGDNQIWV